MSVILDLVCLLIGVLACVWGVMHGFGHIVVWRYAIEAWLLVALLWAINTALALAGQHR